MNYRIIPSGCGYYELWVNDRHVGNYDTWEEAKADLAENLEKIRGGEQLKIYVASSWRNNIQPYVVSELRRSGHEVYDFKNPAPGSDGFHWSEIDMNWKNWTPAKFIEALKHPIAVEGFNRDMEALRGCDVCVLVMPCGRSAHLEAGFALGAGKPLIIMLRDGEPELMYSMTPYMRVDIHGIETCLEKIEEELLNA